MRKMMLALVVALGAAGAVPLAAQEGGPESRAERRERMEEAVRARFLERAAERLALTADQRTRLDAVLEEGAEARRALARESGELRRRMVQAVRDSTTAAGSFEGLLRDLAAVRDREHALETREHRTLAAFLTPRQHAVLLVERARFMERVREMRGRGPRR